MLDCGTGKYGANCNKNCFCKNNGKCSRGSGRCTCQNGYRSYDCSKREAFYVRMCVVSDDDMNVGCDVGTYGPNCRLCPCLNGGTCRSNGSCVCKSGFMGSLCDQRKLLAYFII